MSDEGSPEGRRVAFDEVLARIAARGVSPARDAEARAQQEAARIARLREFYTQRAAERGVPRAQDIRRWVFPEHAEGAIFDAVAEVLRQRGNPTDARWCFFVALGSVGVGKTAALARAVARHRGDAQYVLAPDAAKAFQERLRSFDHDRATQSVVERLRTVDLLAVDELGIEPADLSDELTTLIALRCAEGLATLVASNLTPEAFAERYGSVRIRSRLEADGGSILTFQGRDLRRAR